MTLYPAGAADREAGAPGGDGRIRALLERKCCGAMKVSRMNSFDERAAHAADVLAAAWPQFVSYAELERRGIDRPAQTVYELELRGYGIEHSARGVRLASGGRRGLDRALLGGRASTRAGRSSPGR